MDALLLLRRDILVVCGSSSKGTLMEMSGDLPKWRSRCLGRALSRIPLKSHVRNTFDFAHVVRGQALVADILGTPERTANSVERAMGWVRDRTETYGKTNLRVIDRARSGEQPLSEDRLDLLETRFPSIRLTRRRLLWSLLRSGNLPPDMADHAQHYLEDRSFWIIRTPVVLHMRQRQFSWPISAKQISDNALARLTLLGTLDSLTALWLLLREALDADDDAFVALRIASYIPPTIALYARGSLTCSRVAVLILARVRQLILDQVEAHGRLLDLYSYDLAAASGSAAALALATNSFAEADANNAGKTVPIRNELRSWIARWSAPNRSISERKDVVRWKGDLGPAAYLRETDSQTFPLTSRSMTKLKETLNDYW